MTTKQRERYTSLFEAKQISEDDLINIAYDVTLSYKQKWGDCYKVNSTVAHWLNDKLGRHEYSIWQVKLQLREEIEDTGGPEDTTFYTDNPDHVVIRKGDDYPDNATDTHNYLDFSSVIDSDIVVGVSEWVDKLGGTKDNKLYEALNKALINNIGV